MGICIQAGPLEPAPYIDQVSQVYAPDIRGLITSALRLREDLIQRLKGRVHVRFDDNGDHSTHAYVIAAGIAIVRDVDNPITFAVLFRARHLAQFLRIVTGDEQLPFVRENPIESDFNYPVTITRLREGVISVHVYANVHQPLVVLVTARKSRYLKNGMGDCDLLHGISFVTGPIRHA